VERLAQTEPVEIELPSVLRTLLASIPRAVRSLGRYGCAATAVLNDKGSGLPNYMLAC